MRPTLLQFTVQPTATAERKEGEVCEPDQKLSRARRIISLIPAIYCVGSAVIMHGNQRRWCEAREIMCGSVGGKAT
jgi:hypothetical protein